MTLTVRSATVSGATTKGSALTHAEMDANWAHVIDSANQTFAQSGSGPVTLTSPSNVQTAINELNNGLGTAAIKNVGTSGANVPVCNAANTWGAAQTFSVPPVYTDAPGTLSALNAASVITGNTFEGSAQVFQLTDNGGLGPVFTIKLATSNPAANDIVGLVNYNSNDSAGNATDYADMRVYIDDPTNGSEDAQFQWFTTIAGASSARLQLLAGLVGIGATGGDKGTGTANFTAVYDDNALLSCYPFDAVLDGGIDEAKWDAKVLPREFQAEFEIERVEVVDEKTGEKTVRYRRGKVTREARVEPRRHEEMRQFKARLGTEYDPLTLEGYERHWREKRHLPSMPNEAKFDHKKGMPTGAWIQRLIEDAEIKAILIAELRARLEALEAKA